MATVVAQATPGSSRSSSQGASELSATAPQLTSGSIVSKALGHGQLEPLPVPFWAAEVQLSQSASVQFATPASASPCSSATAAASSPRLNSPAAKMVRQYDTFMFPS